MGNLSDKVRTTERILISRALPGMELARDIYSRTDQMILSRGSILDDQKILKIMSYSIDTITVFKKDDPVEKSLAEQMKNSVEFREFSQHYDDAVTNLKNVFNGVISENKEINQDEIVGDIENIISEVGSTARVFNMLHCIRDYDDVTYMHSMNVSLICNCFARWMGMSENEKRIITIGGILHDVGKTMIPKEVLMKPDRLSPEEYNIIKTHTLRGYGILRDKKIDDKIKMIALQHHERVDKTGYPFGKSGNEVEPLSMVVAIADVFDAMTSARTYRPGYCCFDVIASIENGGNSFAAAYAVPLIQQIAGVYIGHTVILTDDTKGKIIMMNKNELSRPVIQVGGQFIDLTKKRDLKIKEIV